MTRFPSVQHEQNQTKMSADLFLIAGIMCFGLTVVGVAMTMQEFRNANATNHGC